MTTQITRTHELRRFLEEDVLWGRVDVPPETVIRLFSKGKLAAFQRPDGLMVSHVTDGIQPEERVLRIEDTLEGTLPEFLEFNPMLSRQEVRDLLNLRVGDTMTLGGGAFATAHIERVE